MLKFSRALFRFWLVYYNVHWFHSGHNHCAALLYIREKRGFISLSRSVMKCSVEVAAGVFARFRCRHSWNLRLRLTEPDNHRPANTIDVLKPKLSMLSWHSSIATSVMAVRMSMQRPCKLILSGRNCIAYYRKYDQELKIGHYPLQECTEIHESYIVYPCQEEAPLMRFLSLKPNFSQYPSIHTNYIISHCTTL